MGTPNIQQIREHALDELRARADREDLAAMVEAFTALVRLHRPDDCPMLRDSHRDTIAALERLRELVELVERFTPPRRRPEPRQPVHDGNVTNLYEWCRERYRARGAR